MKTLTWTRAYFDALSGMLDKVVETQSEQIVQAARLLADAVKRKANIYAMGCNHAALCTLELYYRTGGMAVINPLRGPGVTLDVDPVTLTTRLERLPGYGTALVEESCLGEGDLLILHSVSGRNAVAIDAALCAREKGASTVCLTNMTTSKAVPSRHPSGKRLLEVCDVAIDNCGPYGDACMQLPGFGDKIAPTSTAVGAAVMNAVMLEACALLLEWGIQPPVFMSANVPGGDAHNDAIMKEYKNSIHYML